MVLRHMILFTCLFVEFVTMRGVPFDIYKSYLEVSGGAAHHASIAEEIQKESECACFQVSYVGICQMWQCT